MKRRLSIIIPTFNSGHTMIRCLESIDRQTFSDYEVLIQDGGSRDNTLALISEFSHIHPDITIRVVQEPDQGVYDAMNKAVERATGDWLYFLGSDDELYDEDGFATMLNSPTAREADVLYGNVKWLTSARSAADAPIYDGPFNLGKLLRKNICHQAIIYRHDLVRRIGPYNVRYRLFADWDYNLHCWSQTPFRYVNVDLAVFTVGGLSSTNADPNFFAEIGVNIMGYFGWSVLHPLLNARVFVGWRGIADLQRSQSILRYVAGSVLRLQARVGERIRRMNLGTDSHPDYQR